LRLQFARQPIQWGPMSAEKADPVSARSSRLLEAGLDEHREVFRHLPSLAPAIHQAATLMAASLAQGGKLLFCGNGGSAADSQHLAAELTGRFVKDRRPLAAVALSTDTSALTCIGNDYSFDEVFSRQVIGIGRQGDCLVGISTSGNSRNVLRAAEAARAAGIHVIGLLGRDGGALRGLCDVAIIVPSTTTARIQEAHIFIGHTMCAMVEEALGLA
jgi:D-sedoheptulose 7-phosphate isomerase